MSRANAFALVLLWCFTCSMAAGSEQSTRLYSRGLVQFHAERYTDALELFDQAVASDPDDVYARYYRAVTRGRLHDLGGAVADLRTVLAAEPRFDQAALELGVVLVQSGAIQEAVRWLEQAQRVPENDAEASLFLGLAQLRLGQLVEARQNFRRGAREPKQSLAAEYYQGVVDYREGKRAEAEEHFQVVIRNSPESEIKREAELFLQALREPALQAYQLYGTAGFQYDTNVVLAPSNEVIKEAAGVSREADGRFTLNAGGTYTLWRRERNQLSVGYDFFQSLHFKLTDFNLQDHGPHVQLVSAYGPVQFGILGRYDYYLLSTSSFLQEGSALPWITIAGDRGRMEVFYRMRRRDFIKRSFWVRDAFNHSTGVRQFFYLDSPDHYLCLGYRFDREDPTNPRPSLNADQFAYDGHEVNGGVGWAFPAALTAEATYAYRHENYARLSNGRHDDQHQFGIVIRKELDAHLAVVTGYFGTINNSSNDFGDKRFDYERHIGSVALEARF